MSHISCLHIGSFKLFVCHVLLSALYKVLDVKERIKSGHFCQVIVVTMQVTFIVLVNVV